MALSGKGTAISQYLKEKNLISEEYEAEREIKQKKIDEAIPFIEEKVAYKESLISQGFENWSRRDS